MRIDSQVARKLQKPGGRSQSPLLATKLAIPSPPAKTVPRVRLTDPFDLAASHRLTLVVAPAGWGKTTFVSQWIARQSQVPCSIAWLSLDVRDNDPNRFLLYLIAALAGTYPGLGETARSLLLAPQPCSTEVILTLLLNEINLLARFLCVVLDDYHLIVSSPIHEAVTFLLEHLPPSLHLIIATRADPPLPLSRMRARGQLLEIRANDLRFTYEETAAFLNTVMGLNLEPEAIARLEERTEGWIAGLQLVALSLQGRDDASRFIDSFTGSNRFILDYLFDEVLSRQPIEVQTFLVETAVLNRLCGPLCEALLGADRGQSLLEKVEAGNLFLVPLDEERRWYRYHHLFADVLQARLRRQGPERIAELHCRAAAWYEQQGMMEEAIYHALEGQHRQMAAQLIERHWDEVWMQGGQRTLEQWLKALPAEWLRTRPMLSVIQATLALYDIRIVAALEALDNCRPAMQEEEDSWTRDVRGRAAILRSNIVRFQGNIELAVALAREGLACLLPDNGVWRVSALFSLGVALFDGDRLAEADAVLTETIAESRQIGITHICAGAAITYGQLHEAQGTLHEAARIYESALAYATERKYHYAVETAVIFAGLARIHYQWNDLAATETCLHEALERKHPVTPLYCYFELIRVRQAQHDTEGVAALIRHLGAADQRTSPPWLLPVLTAVKAGLVKFGQNVDTKALAESDALAWAQDYEMRMPCRPPLRMPYGLREREDLIWARLRIAEGRLQTVRERLESRMAALTQQGCYGSAMEFRVLLATLHKQQCRTDAAVATLEPALALAAREGTIRVFLDAGKPLLPVLRECVARGIEPEAVAKLLDAFRAEGFLQSERREEISALTEMLTEPLSEREREVLRLVTAGLTNAEIADHLFLSIGTVKRHTHNIFIKLGVHNRVNAIARARELKAL
jgi:LuxR family transcriptional regulator, maltose regulon positive regulatory protein